MDKVLLFIPMYNCEKQIIRVLEQLNSKNVKYFNEILVVNNRSTDNSEEAAKEYHNLARIVEDGERIYILTKEELEHTDIY